MCDLVNGEGVAVRTGAPRQEDVRSVIFISGSILCCELKSRRTVIKHKQLHSKGVGMGSI